MKNRFPAALVVLIVLMIQSCGVNSNWMLKTHRDYEFAAIDSLNATKEDYRIDINDIFQMKFFTNDGQRIMDISQATTPGAAQAVSQTNTMNYVIQSDSMVKLPLLGDVNLVGRSIREAELYLQEQYKGYYIDPFVQINVTNRRVVVFPGNGGDAKVLYLANNNTTLLEAIALAGGITERGRASRIKLIRKNEEGERVVYKIDLSTIEGLQYTDILVQANDYIYVDPVPEIGRELLAEIAPVVSLISSAAVIVAILTSP